MSALLTHFHDKKQYRRIVFDKFEGLLYANIAILQNKETGKTYRREISPTMYAIATVEKTKISDIAFQIYIGIFCLVNLSNLLLICYFAQDSTLVINSVPVFLQVLIFAISQLFIHELAHIVTLYLCHEKPEKIGFKLNYGVFPAFYVRMNSIYLLQHRQRFIVHTAGVMLNGLIQIITATCVLYLHTHFLRTALLWYGLSLFFNALPILNSDGYKALLAFAQIEESKVKNQNPRWVQSIQQISVAIAVLYAITFAFVTLIRIF